MKEKQNNWGFNGIDSFAAFESIDFSVISKNKIRYFTYKTLHTSTRLYIEIIINANEEKRK